MAQEGSNGFDGDQLNGYLAEIDAADDALLALKVEHLNACKPPRARIKNTMKQARNAGINMAAFREVVHAHRTKRRVEERLKELEDDDRADYDAMKEALGDFGDTPLGEAALKRAAPKSEALDGLQQGTAPTS